jgi:hypothetical protein
VVDYIVFMTYDLHGQWDAANQFSQEGCPTGSCLRSHVNLTETMTALAMVSTPTSITILCSFQCHPCITYFPPFALLHLPAGNAPD